LTSSRPIGSGELGSGFEKIAAGKFEHVTVGRT
jgi:hypothetical protein